MNEINILYTNYIYRWKTFDITCEGMEKFVGAPHVEYWLTMNYNVCCLRVCIWRELCMWGSFLNTTLWHRGRKWNSFCNFLNTLPVQVLVAPTWQAKQCQFYREFYWVFIKFYKSQCSIK